MIGIICVNCDNKVEVRDGSNVYLGCHKCGYQLVKFDTQVQKTCLECENSELVKEGKEVKVFHTGGHQIYHIKRKGTWPYVPKGTKTSEIIKAKKEEEEMTDDGIADIETEPSTRRLIKRGKIKKGK